jgi:hypothetical protein
VREVRGPVQRGRSGQADIAARQVARAEGARRRRTSQKAWSRRGAVSAEELAHARE